MPAVGASFGFDTYATIAPDLIRGNIVLKKWAVMAAPYFLRQAGPSEALFLSIAFLKSVFFICNNYITSAD
jgi:hypothetical protein